MPLLIRGDSSLPAGQYGASAYQNYAKLQDQAWKSLQSKQGLFFLEHMGQGVEITPKGTVKNKQYDADAFQDLLGFADAYVKARDEDKDGAIGVQDLYKHLEKRSIEKSVSKIDYELRHPELTEEKRQALKASKEKIIQTLNQRAERLLSSLDMPNTKGETDGYITKDEGAALFYTQDGILEAYKRDKKAVYAEYEQSKKSSFRGVNFVLQAAITVTEVFSKLRHNQPAFAQDGIITAPEQLLANVWRFVLPKSFQQAMLRNYQDLQLEQYKPKLTAKKN